MACKIIKAQGIDSIEIHAVNHKAIETLDETDIQAIEAAVSTFNMRVSVLASTIFMMAPLHPDDVIQDFHPEFYKVYGTIDDHLHYLKQTLQLANRLNCKVVRIFPFRAPINRVVIGNNHDQQQIIAHFKQAVKLAKEHDVMLVVENCPYSHLPKGNMTYDVIRAIDSPYLRLLYDPGNSYRANKDRIPPVYLNTTLLEELAHIYPYIGHVHIKDYKYVVDQVKPYDHKVINEGDVPLSEIIKFLANNNYQQAISAEPELPYHQTIESLQALVSMTKKIGFHNSNT